MKLFLATRTYSGVSYLLGVFSTPLKAIAAVRVIDTEPGKAAGKITVKEDGRIEFESYGEIIPFELDERHVEDGRFAITT